MECAKRIVDEIISAGGNCFCKCGILILFAGEKAEIFKQSKWCVRNYLCFGNCINPSYFVAICCKSGEKNFCGKKRCWSFGVSKMCDDCCVRTVRLQKIQCFFYLF